MKKVPFFNDSKVRRTIGGRAVAPGATLFVDERDHPDYTPPPAQRPRKQHSDPVLELLDNPVADIVPDLPKLTDEQFDKLQQAEKDGNKTRKSLLKAFDEEHLRRAELKLGEGNADPDREGEADPDGEGDADPDGDADKVDE